MQRALLANILRRIADEIEKTSMSDWEEFEIELKPRKGRGKAARIADSRTREEIDALWEQLKSATTREAASEILDRFDLTRRELEGLARQRSVHFTKDDKVAKIKEKLVEAAIGSRLNSLAIRGE